MAYDPYKWSKLGAWILVGSGFALGVGFTIALQPQGNGPAFGTAGEWVGGLGALSAAVVALWFGLAEARHRNEERRSQAALLAAYLKGPLRETLDAISALRMPFKVALEAQMATPSGEAFSLIRQARELLMFPALRNNLPKLAVLPRGAGIALAEAIHEIDELIVALGHLEHAPDNLRRDSPSDPDAPWLWKVSQRVDQLTGSLQSVLAYAEECIELALKGDS